MSALQALGRRDAGAAGALRRAKSAGGRHLEMAQNVKRCARGGQGSCRVHCNVASPVRARRRCARRVAAVRSCLPIGSLASSPCFDARRDLASSGPRSRHSLVLERKQTVTRIPLRQVYERDTDRVSVAAYGGLAAAGDTGVHGGCDVREQKLSTIIAKPRAYKSVIRLSTRF